MTHYDVFQRMLKFQFEQELARQTRKVKAPDTNDWLFEVQAVMFALLIIVFLLVR